MKLREEIGDMLENLKEERDDLRVRMHLFKVEAKDEWHDAEKKWRRFQSRSKQVLGETGEAGHDVAAAAKLLGEEIKKGYKRIRHTL